MVKKIQPQSFMYTQISSQELKNRLIKSKTEKLLRDTGYRGNGWLPCGPDKHLTTRKTEKNPSPIQPSLI